MRQSVLWVAVCGVLAGAANANAQTATWADRGYINIGFGVESGSSAMSDTENIVIYEEAGTITSSSTFTSGNILDAGFGFRVWRNLTVGLAYHQGEDDTDGQLTGSIPSPIFFNRPRELDQKVTALVRKEMGTHLVIGWVLPFSEKFDVMLFGGPTSYRLQLDTVDEVEIGEGASPFTTVVARTTVQTRKKSAFGYNVGADATYIVWSNDDVRFGVGGFVRFTKAKADILMLASERETEIGGVQFGIGGRIRF